MKKITLDTFKDVYKSQKGSVETSELLGFELLEELFVDSSGFGQENESALTLNSFEQKLKEHVKQNGVVYTCITGQGQFQVFVGVFKKMPNKKAKKIASNTLLIEQGDMKVIRLYDTDILTFKPKGEIVLNNGGYCTKTTHARMNQFLPTGYFVYAKNKQSHVSTPEGTIFPFNDSGLCFLKIGKTTELCGMNKSIL